MGYLRIIAITVFLYSAGIQAEPENSANPLAFDYDDITADSLYELLGSHVPTKAGAQEFFDKLNSDSKLREQVNSILESDPRFVTRLGQGNEFRQVYDRQEQQWFPEESRGLEYARNSEEATYQSLLAFINSQQNKNETPMPEWLIKIRALGDTLGRHSELPKDFSEAEILGGPENAMIRRGLQPLNSSENSTSPIDGWQVQYDYRRKRQKLEQETVLANTNSDAALNAFRAWKQTQRRKINALRVENIRQALQTATQVKTIKIVRKLLKTGLLNLANSFFGTVLNPDNISDLKIELHNVYPGGSKAVAKKGLLRRIIQKFRGLDTLTQNWIGDPITRTLGKLSKQTASGNTTTANLSWGEFTHWPAWDLIRKWLPAALSVHSLFDAMEVATAGLDPKLDQIDRKSTNLSSTIAAARLRENQLYEMEKFLEGSKEHETAKQFQTRFEGHRFKQRSPDSPIPNPLVAATHAAPNEADAASNLEYWGYRMSPEFWKARDKLVEDKATKTKKKVARGNLTTLGQYLRSFKGGSPPAVLTDKEENRALQKSHNSLKKQRWKEGWQKVHPIVRNMAITGLVYMLLSGGEKAAEQAQKAYDEMAASTSVDGKANIKGEIFRGENGFRTFFRLDEKDDRVNSPHAITGWSSTEGEHTRATLQEGQRKFRIHTMAGTDFSKETEDFKIPIPQIANHHPVEIVLYDTTEGWSYTDDSQFLITSNQTTGALNVELIGHARKAVTDGNGLQIDISYAYTDESTDLSLNTDAIQQTNKRLASLGFTELASAIESKVQELSQDNQEFHLGDLNYVLSNEAYRDESEPSGVWKWLSKDKSDLSDFSQTHGNVLLRIKEMPDFIIAYLNEYKKHDPHLIARVDSLVSRDLGYRAYDTPNAPRAYVVDPENVAQGGFIFYATPFRSPPPDPEIPSPEIPFGPNFTHVDPREWKWTVDLLEEGEAEPPEKSKKYSKLDLEKLKELETHVEELLSNASFRSIPKALRGENNNPPSVAAFKLADQIKAFVLGEIEEPQLIDYLKKKFPAEHNGHFEQEGLKGVLKAIAKQKASELDAQANQVRNNNRTRNADFANDAVAEPIRIILSHLASHDWKQVDPAAYQQHSEEIDQKRAKEKQAEMAKQEAAQRERRAKNDCGSLLDGLKGI